MTANLTHPRCATGLMFGAGTTSRVTLYKRDNFATTEKFLPGIILSQPNLECVSTSCLDIVGIARGKFRGLPTGLHAR